MISFFLSLPLLLCLYLGLRFGVHEWLPLHVTCILLEERGCLGLVFSCSGDAAHSLLTLCAHVRIMEAFFFLLHVLYIYPR